MRRLGVFDRLLLAAFLPLWLGFVWISMGEGLRNGQLRFPLVPQSARSSDAYPTVLEPSWAEDEVTPGIEPGDEIRTVGSVDVRGQTAGGVSIRLIEAGRSGEVEVTLARGERSWQTRLEAVAKRDWWTPLPFSFACVGAVVLVLLRRPDWFLARRLFLSGVLAAIGFLHFFGLRPVIAYASALALVIAIPLATALVLDLTWNLAAPLRRPAWARVVPWLWAVVYGAQFGAMIWWPLPISLHGYLTLRAALVAAWATGLVAGLVMAYRRADASGRRQLRWVVYGFSIGAVGMTAAFILHAAGVPRVWVRVGYAAGSLAMVATPLGILVAIVWFDFLDVDRLISATASYTLLGAALLAAIVAVTPRLAAAAGDALGVSASMAQIGLGAVLAGIAIPVQRALRPRFDRLFFAERYALQEGINRLLDELAVPATVPELMQLAGERIDVLLRPESLAIFAREGDLFVPVFRHADAAPPAFPARGALASALAERATPVAAARWSASSTASSDPFDRAALETLGAAVVAPVRRGEGLSAFLCLGPKRSGDVYTPTDFALLTAVASRLSERLSRIGEVEVLREARVMQAALRRYVPGAVAERVTRGDEPIPGEREVSVLFVDLRDYTRLAEGLGAPEIFSTVNRYTERVSALIHEHGGSVVEFHGDGLLAVFGAPADHPAKERAAVAAAREIVRAVETLAGQPGGRLLSVGAGVATGQAFVGNVRSHDREIWSVIGNTTNLAARLQSLTRELGASIAVDAVTRERADYVCADFAARPAVPIRGRSAPVDVWVLPLPTAKA